MSKFGTIGVLSVSVVIAASLCGCGSSTVSETTSSTSAAAVVTPQAAPPPLSDQDKIDAANYVYSPERQDVNVLPRAAVGVVAQALANKMIDGIIPWDSFNRDHTDRTAENGTGFMMSRDKTIEIDVTFRGGRPDPTSASWLYIIQGNCSAQVGLNLPTDQTRNAFDWIAHCPTGQTVQAPLRFLRLQVRDLNTMTDTYTEALPHEVVGINPDGSKVVLNKQSVEKADTAFITLVNSK